MQISMQILFTAKLRERTEFDTLLRSYGVNQTQLPKGPPAQFAKEIEFLDYDIMLPNNSAIFDELPDKLNALGVKSITRSYSFSFEESDYEQSPLFNLLGTGNSPDAFLEDHGAEFELEIVCDHCKLHKKHLNSPLVIDTSGLAYRHMVFVDRQFLVISEQMAELLEEWKITGYDLKPVTHYGDQEERQPAYQLIPTRVLPALSKETPDLEVLGMRKCPVCNLRGNVKYPLHYNSYDLHQSIQDFNVTREYFVNGNTLTRLPLISSSFRKLVIEYGITPDIRSGEETGELDWRFEPVATV
ncbi:hypothetical protein CBW65_04910 [Tumebacillus avium]|uniref:Uncharacterized protein n=1 Tax=Tumebacillus avium TaxID=1903704 RepID=A0A1Y0IKY8_9BACL|nr:hypothetical protein [Tumebacillus avium]ARU60486.1 hypothetical protein CBW65_04910 [Tumebacillus avium]